MELICDTNVWYYLGNAQIDLSIKDRFVLIGTYHNAVELAYSENLLNDFERTKKAIYAFMTYSSKKIIEPPLIYLKSLDDPQYPYKELDRVNEIIRFLEALLNSRGIKKDKIEDFRKIIGHRRSEFDNATEMMNELAQEVKQNIKNKDSYHKYDTREANKAIISKMVAIQSETAGLSTDFDWENIKLFERFHDYVYRKLGSGAIVFKNNDWYDLFNHAYVTKNRKYLTNDNRKWRQVAKDTGMCHKIIYCDQYLK